jgi:hypothetical protein
MFAPFSIISLNNLVEKKPQNIENSTLSPHQKILVQ